MKGKLQTVPIRKPQAQMERIRQIMHLQERMPTGVFLTRNEALRSIGIKTTGESSYGFCVTTN